MTWRWIRCHGEDWLGDLGWMDGAVDALCKSLLFVPLAFPASDGDSFPSSNSVSHPGMSSVPLTPHPVLRVSEESRTNEAWEEQPAPSQAVTPTPPPRPQ